MRQQNRALLTLMRQHGYVLIRESRHAVWRHSITKRQIVTSLTASDRRVLANIRAQVRRKDVS